MINKKQKKMRIIVRGKPSTSSKKMMNNNQ